MKICRNKTREYHVVNFNIECFVVRGPLLFSLKKVAVPKNELLFRKNELFYGNRHLNMNIKQTDER